LIPTVILAHLPEESKGLGMTCHNCRTQCRKYGTRGGLQRYQCCQCRKVYTEPHERLFENMYTRVDDGLMALRLLLEGNSVRATERLTGLHRDTILDLLVLAGQKSERLMSSKVQNVPATDVQCDELWGYVFKKESHKFPFEAHDYSIGDCWCFVGIERTSKLILAFEVGPRTKMSAIRFLGKLRWATSEEQRFQLSTDGWTPYEPVATTLLIDRCDYGQIIKVYGVPSGEEQRRYSPPEVLSCYSKTIFGEPEKARICTSHVERQNLTMRMQIRRLTRLTNGFSKKVENHRAAIALHFAWYNFCRKHQTIKTTPAIAAGITDHVWSLEELLSSN